MALFFDSDWFDARLAAAGLKRADVAAALGLGEIEIRLDQDILGAATFVCSQLSWLQRARRLPSAPVSQRRLRAMQISGSVSGLRV